jgi:hypothetical protein
MYSSGSSIRSSMHSHVSRRPGNRAQLEEEEKRGRKLQEAHANTLASIAGT